MNQRRIYSQIQNAFRIFVENYMKNSKLSSYLFSKLRVLETLKQLQKKGWIVNIYFLRNSLHFLIKNKY